MSESRSASDRIDQIIDIARGAVHTGNGERENRKVTRVPFTSEVAVIVITASGEKGSPHIVRCENISTGGLCVTSQQEFAVGIRGGVLILRSDGEPVVIGMKVIHARSCGPRGFECGIEFEQQSSAVSMNDFRDTLGNLPQLGRAQAA